MGPILKFLLRHLVLTFSTISPTRLVASHPAFKFSHLTPKLLLSFMDHRHDTFDTGVVPSIDNNSLSDHNNSISFFSDILASPQPTGQCLPPSSIQFRSTFRGIQAPSLLHSIVRDRFYDSFSMLLLIRVLCNPLPLLFRYYVTATFHLGIM